MVYEIKCSLAPRRATVNDAPALAPLAARTFKEGFGMIYSEAVLDAYAAAHLTADQFAAEITDAANYFAVAESQNGVLLGYGKLDTARTPPPGVAGPRPALLQRLYIDADARGTGVADALLSALLAEAQRRGYETLWLEAEPRNERAWRFYVRRGWREVGRVAYVLPTVVNDNVRVLEFALPDK